MKGLRTAVLIGLLVCMSAADAASKEPVLPQLGCEGHGADQPYRPAKAELWTGDGTFTMGVASSLKMSQTEFRFGIGAAGHLRYIGTWMSPRTGVGSSTKDECMALYAIDPPVTEVNPGGNSKCFRDDKTRSPLPMGFLAAAQDDESVLGKELHISIYFADADFTDAKSQYGAYPLGEGFRFAPPPDYGPHPPKNLLKDANNP